MFRAQNAFFVLLIIFFNPVAFAATVTANLPVNATVNATCIFGNISSVNFGNYSGAQNDATGSIEVTCNNGTAYTIGLNAGTGSGATITNRVMTGTPSGTLGYRLFQDPARTINWGNTPPTDTVNLTGNGAVQLSTVYGRIAAGAVLFMLPVQDLAVHVQLQPQQSRLGLMSLLLKKPLMAMWQ